MARPIKKGLTYFPLDVDFFTGSRDIKVLRSRFGADGIAIYLYCLCEIYKNGYYLPIDQDFYDIMSDDLKMDVNKLHLVLKFLCERTMLDGNLLTSDNVLTSVGIQERYQEAVKSRGVKTAVVVDAKFWLLSSEKTQSFIKVQGLCDYSEKNEGFSKNNGDNSEKNTPKEKKRKEKESKAVTRTRGMGNWENVFLTDEEFELLRKNVIDYGRYIDRLGDYMYHHGRTYPSHYNTIMRWAEEDDMLRDDNDLLKKDMRTVPKFDFDKEDSGNGRI